MLEKFSSTVDALKRVSDSNGHRYFAFEQNRDCNRRCSHCGVPGLYDRNSELTVGQSFKAVDRLHAWGFRAGTFLGGEPLAPFTTEEGITFYQQTLELISYATKKGMFIGLSTNGDYFSEGKAMDLKKARLS